MRPLHGTRSSHGATGPHWLARRHWLPACLLAGLFGLLGAAGCINPQTRLQSAEESEREKDLDIMTVGKLTEVANAGPLAVSGVGLVTGLSGTGDSPTGMFRKMLEDELHKQRVEHVRKILDSPDNALVLLSGLIPAGSRKGDVFDIEVTLPPGSKTTSLAGGYLQSCILKNYELKKNLSPKYEKANGPVEGHILAHGSGPIVVSLGGNEESKEARHGRVWSGATSHIDRPFVFIMKDDRKKLAVANVVAQRLNFMFAEDGQKRLDQVARRRFLVLDEMTERLNRQFSTPTPGRSSMSQVLNKEIIQCNVPFAYRFNPERYLLVARQVPLQETTEQMTRCRKRLETMLLDPADTVRAAIRLEALGKESTALFMKGLQSEHPLVRFCSAEALAYLGSTAGCETLARLAEDHPPLRHNCLLALGSLEEGTSRQHLADMLGCPDAEVRCGAFLALRQLDETDRNLNGAPIRQAFWLHSVAPSSRPLVYYSVRQRAEIVLFGSNVQLLPPVRLLAGSEFTVIAELGDDRCTITRFLTHQGTEVRRQCSLRLEDVLRTLAALGGQYSDAVDFLNKSDDPDRRCLSGPVTCRALPEPVPVQTLADGGRDPEFLKTQ